MGDMCIICKYTGAVINPLMARPNIGCPCYNCRRETCVKEKCSVWNYQQNYIYQSALCKSCAEKKR